MNESLPRRRRFPAVRLGTPYLVVTLVGLAAVTLHAALAFRGLFPVSYTWSEVFINYQGGFIRRGLFGQIGFLLDDFVPAYRLMTVTVGILFFVAMAWIVQLAFNAVSFPVFLFLISPAAILFPIYDQRIFGRKDVFIFAAFVLSAVIVKRAGARAALPLIMLVYLIASLFVETALFYFPLAVCLFVALRLPRADLRSRLVTWSSAAAFLTVCFAIQWWFSAGTPAQLEAIVQSWQAKYPGAFLGPGQDAVDFIGITVGEAVGMVKSHLLLPETRVGYLFGFALAAIPFALMLVDYKQAEARRLSPLEWMVPFLITAAPFVLAIDWGRFTYILAMHAFVFLLLTQSRPIEGIPGARVWLLFPNGLYAAAGVLFAGFYATTWRLSHVALPEPSALHPGPLLRWLGLSG